MIVEPRDTKIKDLTSYVYFGEYDGCAIGKLYENRVYVDSQIRHPKTPRLKLYAKEATYFLECYERVVKRIHDRVEVTPLQPFGQSMHGFYVLFDANQTIQDVLDVLNEIHLNYKFVKHIDKV
jgi:hypothetical protein